MMHGSADILSVSVVTNILFQELLSKKYCFVEYNGSMAHRNSIYVV
jgi:hypothetical protein